MKIWPAIDIRGGKCVRLRQGDYDQETVFGDSPKEMALYWAEQGANRLHLVDLDGAREGKPVNFQAVQEIAEAVDIPCELGGGIRDENTICEYLDLGLERVIIGTYALKKPEWFREMCLHYPGKLVLGIDAKNGMVATEGWREASETSAVQLAVQFAESDIAAVIFTDIATDGMMQGPNIPATLLMKEAIHIPIVCSGGITTLEDIQNLYNARIDACIIGRALYEGTIKLAEANEVAFDF
jgi:phosphoribosylformimino-5-aminoimidazole carboxamide ribotide isomerase